MDVTEYKLASGNPILISHAIWKLLHTVKEKVANGEEESKISEFKFLLSGCASQDGTVASTACQAIVDLARTRAVPGRRIITDLTACLVAAKHYGAIASAICNLLSLELKTSDSMMSGYVCPFNLRAPQHPLITVLELKKDAWRDVLNHIGTIIKRREPGSSEHRVVLSRPVFLYILCNPKPSVPESCRQKAWNLLIKTDGTEHLRTEILQWLRTDSSERCIDTNNRLIELAEFANEHNRNDICSILIPSLLSMALELLRHGVDPTSNLDAVSTILNRNVDAHAVDILICLLAEMIAISPSVYLVDILSVASTVLVTTTTWNFIVAHTLIVSIVRWMAYPSGLTSDAMDIAKRLINVITTGPSNNSKIIRVDDAENVIFTISQFDGNVEFYKKLSKCAGEWWTSENLLTWLEKIDKLSANDAMKNYKFIVGAVFLESKDTAVVVKSCDMLVKMWMNGGGQCLSLLLYKLTNSQDIDQTKAILFCLPKLTGSKENVPIVIHTLKTLSAAGKPLNYLAMELYVHALAGEPRCHRYVQSALIDLCNSDNSWQADLTCARAMRYVCEKYPEHGTELVPLLSLLFNRCTERNVNASASSAIILESISALCVAGVTEICSTLRVLSNKINKEKRSIVVRALCQFFGDVSKNPCRDDEDYENVVIKVLTKLWDYAINNKDVEVIEAAFKALSGYRLEAMTVNVLPSRLLKSLTTIDGDTTATATEMDLSTEKTNDISTTAGAVIIPSCFWIAMLNNVNPIGLTAAGTFLENLIKEELYSFRSGIYRWPHGEPLNFKYLSDKSPLRAIGEHVRRYNNDRTITVDDEKLIIVVECLRILSRKYPKPLPPIQWKLLEKAIGVSPDTKKYGYILACHQAQVSPSANEFLEKQLTELTKSWIPSVEQYDKCLNVYEKLDDICRAVGSNILGPYLEITVYTTVEKAIADKDDDAVRMFDRIMRGFARALNDQLIQNDNRSLLATIMEKLINLIRLDDKIFQCYVDTVVKLDSEQVERMTLPSVWLKVTAEKLKKAIKIRANLVLGKIVRVPLTWMNEIIRATASTAAVHTYLLEQLQIILPQMRLEKSNAQWTLDLMHWIGVLVVDHDQTTNIESALFLCEILFITVICLSATDCLIPNDCTLASSNVVRAKLFPQALAGIVKTAHWRDIVPQIMDWLNHMGTTPIPTMYKMVFYNALVSLKNEGYYDLMWTKFLSNPNPINQL